MSPTLDYEPNAYSRADLHETLDSLLGAANSACENLANKMKVVPEVDRQGNSECPFAEDLYGEKEEAAEEARRVLLRLQESRSAICEELSRLERNASLIEGARNDVHGEPAGRSLSSADAQAQAQYERAVKQREQVTEAIERVQEALQTASQKQWPLGEPQRQERYGQPAGTAYNSEAPRDAFLTSPAQPVSSVEDDLSQLLSLGPMSGDGVSDSRNGTVPHE